MRPAPSRTTDSMNPTIVRSALLLVISNGFMTFARDAHLRNLGDRKRYIAAIPASWAIAFFEDTLQVPANRIGFGAMTLGQLKILQEVITLGVFVPFAVFYMRQPIKLDFLWAGLCMMGAVYFMFRSVSGETRSCSSMVVGCECSVRFDLTQGGRSSPSEACR